MLVRFASSPGSTDRRNRGQGEQRRAGHAADRGDKEMVLPDRAETGDRVRFDADRIDGTITIATMDEVKRRSIIMTN